MKKVVITHRIESEVSHLFRADVVINGKDFAMSCFADKDDILRDSCIKACKDRACKELEAKTEEIEFEVRGSEELVDNVFD